MFHNKYIISIETRSNNSLSIAEKRIQAFLHFQQTLSIEAWPPLCLQERIKAPTGLGYTVASSVFRGSTSTFNDDVNDKTSDLFTYKKSNYHYAKENSVHRNENISKYEESNLRQSWDVLIIILAIVCLSVFNRDKIQQITLRCRKANSVLFAHSTNTVNWSMTSIMSLGKYRSSNKVRLYYYGFYL